MAPTALDTLSPLPDSQIMQSGAQYLTTNGIDKLLGALLESIARDKPDKPVQWMVDVFSSSSTVKQAVQKASQGTQQEMSSDRTEALLKVFRVLDKEGTGKVHLSDLQTYTSKHGVAPLAPSDVEQIFMNIDADNNNLVAADEFLSYMGKATCNMSDSDFQNKVNAMTQV